MSKRVSLDILDLPETTRVDDVPQLEEKDKKMVCLLVSLGEPSEAVARKLGIERGQVEALLASDEGTELVIRFQSSLFPDPLVRAKRMAHLALDAQAKILLQCKPGPVLAKVASDVLDRATGKPVQVQEQKGGQVNMATIEEADRALRAQEERLKRLEDTQRRLIAARGKR